MPTDKRRLSITRVNFKGCVIVKQGSYGLQDLTRKGGFDEGEEKPENRAGGLLGTEGCTFF